MQQQRNAYIISGRDFKFKNLKKSKLRDEEKSKVFYEIKSAFHIFNLYKAQKKYKDLTAVVH